MFLVVGGFGTGTHLVASLLDSHPDLTCYDELEKGDALPLGHKDLEALGPNEGAILHYSVFLSKFTEKQRQLAMTARVVHVMRSAHRISGWETLHLKQMTKVFEKWPFLDAFSINYEHLTGNKNIVEARLPELLKFLGVRDTLLTTTFVKGAGVLKQKKVR